jgi:ketosteroid isomerase-like protein
MRCRTLFFLAACVVLFSCNNRNEDPAKRHEAMKQRMDSLRSDLLQADISFSQLSEQKGRNIAFAEFAAENATVLRPYSMPVSGKDSIIKLLEAHPDSNYKLTWVPIRAEVAHSGEMGFTYGTYALVIKNVGHEEGTYCTVWKKDKDKKWKFVLDTGNEGLKPAEKAADMKIDAEEAGIEKGKSNKK